MQIHRRWWRRRWSHNPETLEGVDLQTIFSPTLNCNADSSASILGKADVPYGDPSASPPAAASPPSASLGLMLLHAAETRRPRGSGCGRSSHGCHSFAELCELGTIMCSMALGRGALRRHASLLLWRSVSSSAERVSATQRWIDRSASPHLTHPLPKRRRLSCCCRDLR